MTKSERELRQYRLMHDRLTGFLAGTLGIGDAISDLEGHPKQSESETTRPVSKSQHGRALNDGIGHDLSTCPGLTVSVRIS